MMIDFRSGGGTELEGNSDGLGLAGTELFVCLRMLKKSGGGLADELAGWGAGSGGRFKIVLRSGGGVLVCLGAGSLLTVVTCAAIGGEADLDPGAE